MVAVSSAARGGSGRRTPVRAEQGHRAATHREPLGVDLGCPTPIPTPRSEREALGAFTGDEQHPLLLDVAAPPRFCRWPGITPSPGRAGTRGCVAADGQGIGAPGENPSISGRGAGRSLLWPRSRYSASNPAAPSASGSKVSTGGSRCRRRWRTARSVTVPWPRSGRSSPPTRQSRRPRHQ